MRTIRVLIILLVGLISVPAVFGGSFERDRELMVRQQLEERGVSNEAVLDAMEHVPRHLFVPEDYRVHAYADGPLPIGKGQTISQPYIVGAMTELIQPEADHVVLEIGTGSGYQAAVLAEIVKHVYTIEIVEELAETADARLQEMGYSNITVRAGDGYRGWPEHAPFDGIVVTAGAEHVPPALVEQLKPGGTMVIPVGPQSRGQELRVIRKDAEGTVSQEDVMAVRFVPLTGEGQGEGF